MDTQLLYALAEHNGRRFYWPARDPFFEEFLARHRATIPTIIIAHEDLIAELKRIGWVRQENATTLRITAPLEHNDLAAVEIRLKSACLTAETPLDTSLPLLQGLYSEGRLLRAFQLLAQYTYSLGRTGEGLQQYAAQRNWIRQSPYRRTDSLPLYWIRPPAENLAADADKAA